MLQEMCLSISCPFPTVTGVLCVHGGVSVVLLQLGLSCTTELCHAPVLYSRSQSFRGQLFLHVKKLLLLIWLISLGGHALFLMRSREVDLGQSGERRDWEEGGNYGWDVINERRIKFLCFACFLSFVSKL